MDAAGGYVVFEGRVRNRNEGRDVLSLEYEAFSEMAVKTGNAVLEEAGKHFPILEARCVHRTGHIQIGEIAIRVEVASAHRKAAFEACGWIVDEVKQRVPIWKKEHYADGDSGWVVAQASSVFPLPNLDQDGEAAYYARQVTLKEVGAEGQAKLRAAKILVVGAGGLGSSALLYLAAAGVGTIGIAEFDDLDASNLHRQVLYSVGEIGKPKAETAASRLRALNPYIEVVTHPERVTVANVEGILEGYEVVLECTDNFRTKFLMNDVCVQLGKALIQASIYQYEGQLIVYTPGSPCLRCLWPETPEEGCVGSCAEVGVLGVVPGVFGVLQATESIKLVLGLPSPLREGKMLLLDLLAYRQQMVGIVRNPSCPACGSGVAVDGSSFELEASDIDLADYLVVDVREAEEVAAQPMASALNLPTSRFDPSELPDANRYLLVCAHGIRSEAIARYFRDQGDARFYSLIGGARSLRSVRRT